MKKTLLAAAILSASVGAQAEETSQPMFPFSHAPAPVVDQETVQAWLEMNQKAREYFIAYHAQVVEAQKQARANTPEFLRIPAIPQIPKFDADRFQAFVAMSENIREDVRKLSESRIQAFQQSFVNPVVDIERVLVDRQKELDTALADAEKRADEIAKSL